MHRGLWLLATSSFLSLTALNATPQIAAPLPPTLNPERSDYRVDIKHEYYGEEPEDIENYAVESETLREVRQAIQNSYRQYVINIHVYGGVVTLSGTVTSKQDKQGIEDKIRNIRNVHRINNQIQVINAPNYSR